MAIPDSIKCFKPTEFGAVEIRRISDKYYVYKIKSKWDSVKGVSRKVTDKCLGKITEKDGFIPNEYAARLKAPKNPIVRNYGAFEIASQLSPDLEERLKAFFPDIYREIEVIAQLRLIAGSCGKKLKDDFEKSYLSDLHPDLSVGDFRVKTIYSKIADRQDSVQAFMKSYIKEGSKLLFDGTTIFSRADDSCCQSGYNPNHSLNPQVRLLYIFDRTSFMPVFYRMVPGNIVDRKTLKETVISSGCHNCIIIADKGFYSKVNLSFLMNEKLDFILPLQSNTTLIAKDFETNIDDRKFDGRFAFKDRIIWFKKYPTGNLGNYVYLFRDDQRKGLAELRFQEQLEASYGEEEITETDFFADTRRGLYAFVSNLDQNPKSIFMSYKERWDIEQCFDYLKNSVSTTAPYQRTNENLFAWSFINHVSLLYYYGIVRALREKNMNKDYSVSDIISIGKNVYKVNADNQFRVSEISKKDSDVLTVLGVSLYP